MKKEISLEMYNKMPVPKAVMKNIVPAMVAMLMVLVYNLADVFFVAQTNDPLQVAAVSLATPVFLIFMAVGTVFGVGGTSVISRAIGEGRKEYAKKVSAFCFWGSIALGITMLGVVWIFMDQILAMIGATENTWEFAKQYLSIVSFCGTFVMIGVGYSNILRAEGQATNAMVGMLIGNLLNIILDAFFILVLGWDIVGIAVATVIGNVAAGLFYIQIFLRGKSTLSIKLKDFSIKDKIPIGVLSIGIPAALASLLMSIAQIFMYSQISKYSDLAVAGIGVASKVTMITGLVCIGIGQGVQPLFGYCVGAKLWDRHRAIMKFSVIFALALGTVLTGVCYLFTEQIVRAFLTDVTAFDYAVKFARILLMAGWIVGAYFVILNAMQAMGAAVPSLIINLSRQGLIYVPALLIMSSIIGLNGIIWAQPLADVFSFLMTIILYRYTFKRLIKKEQTQLKAQDEAVLSYN